MGCEKNNNSDSRQIKTIIFTSLVAIIVLYLFSSFPGLYRSLEGLQSAKRVSFLNDVSDYLFIAVGNYGFERGRVNVVLNDSGPVEKMEANRKFIIKRRNEGDGSLSKALKSLSEIDLPGSEKKIRQVKKIQDQINELRQKTNKDLVVPQSLRKQGLATIWFAAMTKYIESIEALLVTISIDISDADGVISRYSSLKHEVLALRNTAGPEMSILSATILSQKPIKAELIEKIEKLHINTLQHFKNIAAICQGFSKPDIPNALNQLKQSYFSNYLAYRNEILPLAKVGGPYPYSQAEFLSHGVNALKEISHFMDVIVLETKSYAANNLNENRRQMIFQGVSSAGSLLVVFLIMFYINSKVISPIGRLTSILRKFSKKQLGLDVPFLKEDNEIGEMAKAVEIFRQKSIELDEDNRLLKLAEAEKEKLISELQKALKEVKTLSGLLPICAQCKKIRDDKGYWNTLEAYIEQHSDASFSHGMCSECSDKLYGNEDWYIEMKKKNDYE
ncbi:HAMP domain-containing protein [Desulfobacter postgatei]|uniref:Signal transduction histidine kinase, nitrate/nitrite-specific n=1 Tax=Desulfobacter postgatei 2ac9 TaxID=879212 RepID=I5B7B5_9BACT|nr:HAMP domain-containing protein [Desulfobacter postgatei]EIM65378.1 signal transduction histidine kinase, nitrate/nitrite-specific [Desulfobacter postgatei 2ac9]